MKWMIVPVLAALALAPAAYAKKVDQCGSTGNASDITEATRDFNYCLKGNTCSPALNTQIFGNDEGRLPRAGNGQTYYEARVGQDRSGGAGARRLVYLIGGTAMTTNATIDAKYFTPDHYDSFCELP